MSEVPKGTSEKGGLAAEQAGPAVGTGPGRPAVPKKPETPSGPATTEELAKVREIILGPEAARRPGKAEVDRLREILFGAQMEEYERRFADLHRELERVLSDLRLVRDGVGEFEKAQTKQIETLEREMRRNADELRREVERMGTREALLQQLLTQMRQQEGAIQSLSESITRLHETLASQERELRMLKTSASEQREQQERKLDALKRELREAEDTLRAELRRIGDRLDDQKTDRRALAAMLMEVATRLETGTSVSGLLEELTSSAEG